MAAPQQGRAVGQPGRAREAATPTPQDARDIAAKVEQDMDAAFGAASRMAKFVVRLTTTPKMDLAKKFIRAVFDEDR